MKQNGETELTGIPEEASISNPSRTLVRLRGSHSSHQEIVAVARPLRRLDDVIGDPPPHDDPPPPPPPVSTPDLAIQINFCLNDSLKASIIGAVRQAIPNSDVRTACVNNRQRIGIWLRPFVNDNDNQARTRGVGRINIIGAGESLAFFINSAQIRRQAFAEWNKAPKRLNGDGYPDPDGPIHLTGFTVNFEGPNKVLTRVEGFDERPWPDVDFVLTITDTLSVSGGEVRCDTDVDVDVDTSWINFLTGLFLFVLPPLGAVFLVQRIIIANRDEPDADGGAGSAVPQMIPKEILIPEGLKVVASYTRIEVFSGGVVAGGGFGLVPRTPEVSITGPLQISVVEGAASVTGSFTLHTEDLRPPFSQVLSTNFAALINPPVALIPRIEWSGDGVALSPSGEKTGFRFNLGDAKAGDILTRRVKVLVVDADGLTASAERIVRIFITPEDDDFPPICRIRPWLPVCDEPFARASSTRRSLRT